MDSRFISGSQPGQRNPPYTDGNSQFSHGSELQSHRTSSTSINLDENLSRLFECMRLEYGTGGFLISPKWKNFRSQKLQFAEKTRLNNAIWRCWHIQYSKQKRPLFCQFVPPLSEERQPFKKKPLAVILEGRYWRRKLEAVAREYKKLRVYYKQWSKTPNSSSPLQHLSLRAQQIDQEIAYKLEEKERRRKRTISSESSDDVLPTSPHTAYSDTQVDQMLNVMDTALNHDIALSSLPDTLFTSRSTMFGGTVIPQELIEQQTLSKRPTDAPDVFQVPTLDSLQPNLDEFMEHFESFTGMLMAKQAENVENQQNYVGQGDYQAANSAALFVNQGVPFEGTVPGQEEVMDHSGAYDAVTQQMFQANTADNPQMSEQGISTAGQVLMEISSATPAVDYPFDYSNVLPSEGFNAQQTVPAQSPGLNESNKQNTVLTSPVEQPQMPSYSTQQQQQYLSPLEEIQAQQLAAAQVGNVLSPPPSQYVANVDPFTSSRLADTVTTPNQPRKGRLPRNVSDSQLYTMDLSQLGTSFQTNLFPSMESNLPPQLEAPNLAAHLQSIQPRTRIASIPSTANPSKRARLPRNMSDSRLSSLASMSRSPTSPPSLPTVQSLDVANQPSQPMSASIQQPTKRKSGRFPRVMSDTSLLNMGQQQHQLPTVSAVTKMPTSQRRRKMSDPQLISAAVAAMPSHSASFTSAAETQLYRTSSTLSSVSNTQFLEQLLTAPAVSSSPGGVSTMPQAAVTPQAATSSVLSQLLTQQSTPSPAATAQIPAARDSSTLGGSQDPALLNQLYQLKQVLQKQTVPTELVNALNSLTNTGTVQVVQEQAQAVQQKTATVRPSLQMKPQNQNAITQALQSLLRGSPNVAIQPSTPNMQTTQVGSFSAQTPLQAPVITSQNIPVPTVTIKHQPQNKPPGPAVNQNILPSTAVILTPQGGIQSTGMSVQDTQTVQMNHVPAVTTTPTPQVVNIGHPAIQGQRIILPANVNLSTLSLAQLGLSPATLQTVAVTVPSSVANSSSSLSTVATMTAGAKTPLPATISVSSTGVVTESQDTGGMRPAQSLPTPAKPTRPVTAEQREQYKEHRRISHITAEQKRRGNIKMGFDQLMSLVPSLANQRNSKVSKATVLQKTVEYTTKLQRERHTMQEEADMLRKQIQELNTSISMCQQQLPATGVPVARQRVDQMWTMFNQYVKTRTQDNFKFWIFSVLMRQLFEEYNNMVSTASVEDFCRTVLAWLEQHCSLPALRPAALSSLRDLSKATSILSDPSKVPEQALRATTSRDPTDLSAMMAPPGASGGARNTGASGGFS